MTVAEAIAHLRAVGEDRETIYTLYVTDEQRRLEGVTSIRALLLTKDEEHRTDHAARCHLRNDRY